MSHSDPGGRCASNHSRLVNARIPIHGAAVGPGPRGAVRALAPVLPWRIWAALEALLLALVAVTRAVYSPSTTISLLALAGVPVASAVVSIST